MAEGSSSLVQPPVGSNLTLFLIQVVVILVVVRLLGKLLAKIKQPMVIGEIVAGILLGPSAFGYIPGFSDTLFPTDSLPTLQLFANIGLIFFMFYLGLEVDPSVMTAQWKVSLPVAVSSIIIPFGCGSALSVWLYKIDTSDTGVEFTSFLLFIGTALSFTAFPVLARILTSTQLISSPVGSQALGAAAIDDLLAWCTLALTLSYASGGSPINGLYTALIAIGFVLFLVFPVRKLLFWIHSKLLAKGDELNKNFIAAILFGLCIAAWFAEIIGIHAFFGAFAFGVIVPKGGQLVHELAPKIELLIVEFFLPLYFANSGLRTSIGALNTGTLWGACIVTILVASVAKIAPVTISTRLFGRDWRLCITLGILMNTRGLVSLIVLNIGLDLGILTTKIFTIMVIMALVTTFMTSPLLYYLYQKPYMEEKRKRKLEEGHKEDPSNGVEVDDETQTDDPEITPPVDDQSIHWADWKKSVDFIRKEQRKEIDSKRDSISPSPSNTEMGNL